MSKENNLQSLLGGRWYINKDYALASYPLLVNLLNGKGFKEPAVKTPELFKLLKGSATPHAVQGFNDDDNQSDYVGVIHLKNPIYKYNQSCGPEGTKAKMRQMAHFKDDPNCIGVAFDVDSGGGQVSGTPEFYDYIKAFSKPTVAYTDGMMCSAAYYIGAATDYIVSNKRADAIGSIGTMISFVDTTGILEKKGAKVVTAYATKSTEKNSDFEQLLKGDAAPYIKNQLDPITETFHEDMLAARPGLNPEVLKGNTWKGSEALDMGLIDEVGTFQDAIDKVYELAEANKPQINSSMSQKSHPLLQAALGLETPFADTANVYLQENQVEAVEALLGANNQTIADLKQQLQTAKDAGTTENTAVTTAVQAALVEAEVNNPETLTNVQGVEALQSLVAEYGARPATTPTQVAADGDAPSDTDGVDMTLAHNQAAYEMLKG